MNCVWCSLLSCIVSNDKELSSGHSEQAIVQIGMASEKWQQQKYTAHTEREIVGDGYRAKKAKRCASHILRCIRQIIIANSTAHRRRKRQSIEILFGNFEQIDFWYDKKITM